MSEHHVTPKTYVKIFLALMVLTVITVAVSFIDLGPFSLVIALLIAATKASLVVLWFMHVRYSDRLTQIIVVAGLYWFVLVMLGFTFADYLTRGWLPIHLGPQ